MKNAEKVIKDYIEAIASSEGREAASATSVEIRGEDAIFVKRPHEQTGQVVTVGRLRLMVHYMQDHLTRKAA
ncbi:MAG TPA: hypothetical protein VKA31_00850 [Mariprofundaceae bacterium]|nr:hypothetical protein [Mariprofundaceae bacterium]